MARKSSIPPRELGHRWYLAEWAEIRGKRQADAQRELGWPKATASELWNGNQRYTQNLVDQVAAWLDLKPYELLMAPAEAEALRQVRAAAYAIAAESGQDFEPAPPANAHAQRRAGSKG
jgi:transcriptional regulator with XRE-family HTH domain